MNVFLTGASGFVGSAIVSKLIGAGYRVMGLARSDEAAATLVAAGAAVHRGRLEDHHSLRRGAAETDSVIHAAFDHDFSRLVENSDVDRLTIEAIGGALKGSYRPLIVTSGLPVMLGRSSTEDDIPPAGENGIPRVSEQTAMSLLESGVRSCLVRLSQVHDQTKQGFSNYLLAHAREKGISAYVGDGSNRWPVIHRFDAARLYRNVLEKGGAGQFYHAVAEEGLHVRAIAEAISRRIDVPVVAITKEDSASHFGWLDRIVRMDVPASSALTQERLNWRPKEPSDFVADLSMQIAVVFHPRRGSG